MNVEVTQAAERDREGFSLLTLSVPEIAEQRTLDLGLQAVELYSQEPSSVAGDLLIVAATCYCVDKLVPRSQTYDRWTRDFAVTFPVSAPEIWNEVASDLNQAVGFLTGDLWSFRFTQAPYPFYVTPPRRRRRNATPPERQPQAVSLFSGGLDSLAGAVDLLAGLGGEPALLVGHYDSPTGEQGRVWRRLSDGDTDTVQIARARVRLKPARSPETTLRSRSIIFLALGAYLASGLGPDMPLYAYENGHIALNPPLTRSRAGSCSTRTMHPYFITTMRDIFARIGLTNPLLCPFEFKTKGECITECADLALLRQALTDSVSCSHGQRRRYWERPQARNCGYCVPCLIRRGGLHAADLDDGEHYGFDVCEGEVPAEAVTQDDLRAVIDAVERERTPAEYAQDIIRAANVDRLPERAALLARGYGEIRQLFTDKGTPAFRRFAGG